MVKQSYYNSIYNLAKVSLNNQFALLKNVYFIQ